MSNKPLESLPNQPSDRLDWFLPLLFVLWAALVSVLYYALFALKVPAISGLLERWFS